MSLDTYANLKTELAAWAGRSDLTSYLDSYIDMFEAWCNRNLRVRQMEGEATSVASEYMDLPNDFVELRDIQWQGSPRRQLSYVTPEYADLYDSSGAAGTPRYYTIVGNQIRLVPAPDATTTIRISYWQKVPALSGSNTTNWLLTAFPDAYLYGCLLHARMFVSDEGRAAAIDAGWQRVMQELQASGRKSNTGGSLAVKTA